MSCLGVLMKLKRDGCHHLHHTRLWQLYRPQSRLNNERASHHTGWTRSATAVLPVRSVGVTSLWYMISQNIRSRKKHCPWLALWSGQVPQDSVICIGEIVKTWRTNINLASRFSTQPTTPAANPLHTRLAQIDVHQWWLCLTTTICTKIWKKGQ